MKRWKQCLILTCLLITSACSVEDERDVTKEEKQSEQVSKHIGEMKVVAKQLDIPWSIQKTDDSFYISERKGTVAVIKGNKLSREKVHFKKDLSAQPEAGFLGFVLHPDFKESQLAFAYYTYDQEGKSFNRVVTLKRENNEWKEEQTLLDNIPSGQYHHGGRMKLGNDHLLYITTGDALNEESAQDAKSLNGKILRMNLDGSIPKDNPFTNSYTYSYGHRNPQGLAWSEEGVLYSSEHGPSAHDELNEIQMGKSYGWPTIKGSESNKGMINPLIHSGDQTWAPSGIAYKNGALYVATLMGEALKRYNIETNDMEDIVTGVGRIRDTFIEGNLLYFVSNNGDGRGEVNSDDDHLYVIELQ